ncbi:hypothetical protein IKE86_02765 [Candidatus Saccharibacteria bacterium]|nr:hypothetical protein [Candidatus Saccharibacteria bacterium]
MRKGDTLIEVMFSVAIFGLVAIGAISLMNRGLASVQNNLETTMARQEIDTQAEALRFIHSAYLTEQKTTEPAATEGAEPIQTNNFRNLWQAITSQTYPASTVNASGEYIGGVINEDSNFFTRTVDNRSNCNSLFDIDDDGQFNVPSKSFVINPRGLNRLTETDASGKLKVLSDTDIRRDILMVANDPSASFATTSTYPRLIYGATSTSSDNLSDAIAEGNIYKLNNAGARLDQSEGLWVTAIASNSGLQCYDESGNPEGSVRPDFYDFHIQTCWDSIAGNASVISSTVRLFNPDQVNLKKQGMITFDNVEWEKYDNATHTGSTCGSEVCATCHTQTSGTDIEFIGYTSDIMDEGVRYPINDRLYFTLDVDVDTSGILTHPGGEGLTITLGPIKANLTDSGGNITGTETKTVNSRRFHLQMVRSGNHYSACAGEVCVEADSTEANVFIDYNFKHNGHCCSAISRAKLSNIEMVGNDITEETTGGCVRVTPTETSVPIAIPTPTEPDPEQPVIVGELPTTLEESSIFIVTTWNRLNTDIDSHLLGGPDDVHVWYSARQAGQDITLPNGDGTTKQYNLDIDALGEPNYNSLRDENCGTNCGDGYIEVVAIRNIRAGTYRFYAHDFSSQSLDSKNLIVRVFTGYASARVGAFPKNTQPIATFNYTLSGYSSQRYWYVSDITVNDNGTVVVKKQDKLVDGI